MSRLESGRDKGVTLAGNKLARVKWSFSFSAWIITLWLEMFVWKYSNVGAHHWISWSVACALSPALHHTTLELPRTSAVSGSQWVWSGLWSHSEPLCQHNVEFQATMAEWDGGYRDERERLTSQQSQNFLWSRKLRWGGERPTEAGFTGVCFIAWNALFVWTTSNAVIREWIIISCSQVDVYRFTTISLQESHKENKIETWTNLDYSSLRLTRNKPNIKTRWIF